MDDGVRVLDLCYAGRAWLLLPSGSARRAPDAGVAHGFGVPWPAPFSAVFADGGRLWLQVARRRWDVATIAAVRQVRESPERAVYALELAGGGADEVDVVFPPDVRGWRAGDPAHDEIDSWGEDVLKVLPYVAADGWASRRETVAEWAARVTPLWTAGIPVAPPGEVP